jgi:hypothetical protein
MKNGGFSLIEVLVATLILVTAVGSLALIYPGIFTGLTNDTQTLRAWEIAKRNIETLKNASFNTLNANGVAYDPASEAPITNSFCPDGAVAGTCMCQGTTASYCCNGVYQTTQCSSVNNNFTSFYYVEKMKFSNGSVATDLLKVTVVVCYRSGNRIIGSDSNLNGIKDTGEGTNNKINSPITLTTLVMKIS